MRTLLILLALASVGAAADPKPQLSYSELLATVEAGYPTLVYAGLTASETGAVLKEPIPSGYPAPAAADGVAVDRIPGEKAGVYLCYWDAVAKEPKMLLIREAKSAIVPALGPLQPTLVGPWVIYPAQSCPNGKCPNAR